MKTESSFFGVRMFDRRLFTNFDWTLLALVLLITGFGVVNIFSGGAERGGAALKGFVQNLPVGLS